MAPEFSKEATSLARDFLKMFLYFSGKCRNSTCPGDVFALDLVRYMHWSFSLYTASDSLTLNLDVSGGFMVYLPVGLSNVHRGVCVDGSVDTSKYKLCDGLGQEGTPRGGLG